MVKWLVQVIHWLHSWLSPNLEKNDRIGYLGGVEFSLRMLCVINKIVKYKGGFYSLIPVVFK